MSSLNPVLTIGTQVAEPIWLHHKKSWPEAFAEAGELLAKVAIPDAAQRLEDYPHQFSGGMRQRVMIAMALACQPRLIIADEPTTALDVTVQAQILSLLKNLTKELGSSLILITHDLGVVARYADKVAVMYGGRVVETASALDLYKTQDIPTPKGLMDSIPKLDGDPGSRLYTIEGQPPDLSDLPSGCAFHPRCPYAHEACTASKTALTAIATNHQRACFGYECDANILEVADLKVHFPITEGLLKRQVGSIAAVDGVSFHIKRGETFSLVGESGCGKSTTALSVLGMQSILSGQITFDGENITGYTRRKCAVSGEKCKWSIKILSALNPRMKVGAIIGEPLRVHGMAGDREQYRARIRYLMKTVGLLDEMSERYPHEFSGADSVSESALRGRLRWSPN